MAVEGTGRGEFAETVSDHVLGDEHGNEDLAVVHVEGVPDELGEYHGTAGPGLDRLLGAAGLFHAFDFFDQMIVHKRTFFD